MDLGLNQMVEGELNSALSYLRSKDVLSVMSLTDPQLRRVYGALVCVEEVANMNREMLLDWSRPLELLKCALYFLDNAGHFTSSPAREHISALCDLIVPIEVQP